MEILDHGENLVCQVPMVNQDKEVKLDHRVNLDPRDNKDHKDLVERMVCLDHKVPEEKTVKQELQVFPFVIFLFLFLC